MINQAIIAAPYIHLKKYFSSIDLPIMDNSGSWKIVIFISRGQNFFFFFKMKIFFNEIFFYSQNFFHEIFFLLSERIMVVHAKTARFDPGDVILGSRSAAPSAKNSAHSSMNSEIDENSENFPHPNLNASKSNWMTFVWELRIEFDGEAKKLERG